MMMDIPKELIPKEIKILIAFDKKIGKLDYFDIKETYNIESRSVIGSFWEADIPILFELCKKHPKLHIISRMPGGEYRNCYVPGAISYKLGDGDANPELRLELPPEVKRAVTTGFNHLHRALNS